MHLPCVVEVVVVDVANPLFDMPGQADEVQILAAASAMELAFHCVAGRCNCATSGHFKARLIDLAHSCARQCLTRDVGGRRGTNDEAAFRAIFQRIVPDRYVAWLTTFQRDIALVARLAAMPAETRLVTFGKTAQAKQETLTLPPLSSARAGQLDHFATIWPPSPPEQGVR